MKQLIACIILITLYVTSFSQSHTGFVEYQKANREAVINEIPFSDKTTRDAIDNKMLQMGYKGKEIQDFTVYKGVKMPEWGTDFYDLYFSADKKSKKEKETSILTLMIAKGIDNFVTDSSDAPLINNAKKYLDSIKIMIAAYDLEQQILAQQEAVKKADKKFSSLVADGQSLDKKRKNIENNIQQNMADQTAQQQELDKQKQILENLKAKRKQ